MPDDLKRWTETEIALFRYLVSLGLSSHEICEVMALAGLTVRDQNKIQDKARRMGLVLGERQARPITRVIHKRRFDVTTR